ncbi:MAG: hypothetical protein Q8P44_00315, partial [Dehalococcoidia bacterium]|nr:hypothetical protein [Dehalococcoidia bacterium]
MKTLSAALEAAAKADSHTPAVRVRLYNQRPNLPRYQFTSIYAGLETDNYNAACFAGDGSLNRARIQSGAPNYSAYHSRVTTPGPGSDFTSWTLVDVVSTASKVALAVYGATVMLFTLNVDGLTLQVKTSTDNGATWSAWVSIFTCAVTPGHIAAAFNADGSICMLFFDEGNTIKTAKYEAAAWGAPAAWTNTLTAINGISAIFDAAWRLAFAGTDGSSNEGVWICSYTTAYAWTALLNVITASPGAAIKFWFPSLDKPSSFNMIFMEDFSGTEAYSQMRLTAEAASSVFADNLWTEPAVFNNYGKTIFTLLHNTVYLWIVRQNRILIAPTDSNMQDISANLQNVEAITTPRDGSVAVELRNDIKQYNSPILGIGAQLEVEWGYQTTSGALFASVSTYWIERLEYRREAYKSTLVIHALDAWGVLKKLRARYQYVWAAGATSIEDILKWLLA